MKLFTLSVVLDKLTGIDALEDDTSIYYTDGIIDNYKNNGNLCYSQARAYINENPDKIINSKLEDAVEELLAECDSKLEHIKNMLDKDESLIRLAETQAAFKELSELTKELNVSSEQMKSDNDADEFMKKYIDWKKAADKIE
ncbi:MAG: hypothetical protein HGA22_00350 [Clostridiales bacterium]|nr:hypothetical protein [Clostridiales bacterium]